LGKPNKKAPLKGKKQKRHRSSAQAFLLCKGFQAICQPGQASDQKIRQEIQKTDEQRLAFGLEKHKNLFLKFIKQPQVPIDNNQAERDLRMMKVKQKVSGCFRSQISAQHFARIRGYISTVKKNERSVLVEIQNAFEGNHFIPVMAV
jgi:transposase